MKIRFLLLCVSLAALVGLECYFGASFAARIGQTTALPNDRPAAPNIHLGDVLAAAR